MKTTDQKNINDEFVTELQTALIDSIGIDFESMINRGVKQAASLWRISDGTTEEFKTFCIDNFIQDTS